jgi:hypothetical protein
MLNSYNGWMTKKVLYLRQELVSKHQHHFYIHIKIQPATKMISLELSFTLWYTSKFQMIELSIIQGLYVAISITHTVTIFQAPISLTT